MLTEEHATSLKKQIIQHIEKNFPEDKIDFAVKKIESMSSKELEEFVVKNGLAQSSSNQECVFCHIVSGGIHAVKIGENEDAIAVLEINPISRGHTMIIPKNHEQEKLSPGVFTLEKEISKKLQKILKPKAVISHKANLFGHETIALIPQYADETSDSKRHPATPEQLKEIQHSLSEKEAEKSQEKGEKEKPKKVEKSEKAPKKPKAIKEEKMWLPNRIP